MSDETAHQSEPDSRTGSSPCPNRDSCEKSVCDRDRRRLLGAVAAASSIPLAGCTGLFASPDTERPDEALFDIEYLQQEETIQVSERRTLLGAGEEQGMDLPYACRAGFCGVCLSQADDDAREVLNMAVNDFDPLTEEAVAAGYFLPCTSRPRDDFALDTEVSPGDLDEFQEEEEDEEDEEADEEEAVGRLHTVTYLNEQWSIEVPEDQNLLEAGEDRGLELPYQCRVGTCGECLAKTDGDATELVEMTENDYDPLDDDAIEEGYFLTCTGYPRASFSLESGVFTDLEG